VFVNEQDIACFRDLHDQGVELECRDTPQAKKQLLNDIIPLAE
jgi:mannose/fructose/N-acetylgalactosamine-specific phosphotransferase system component IIB